MEVAEQQDRLVAVNSNATSLIIGNLEESVTEEELLKRFQVYGPVNSCHIIRDRISMQSLSYGYVNYVKAWHASLALQVLDGCSMKGQPLRVALQPKGLKANAMERNLFINHLEPSITCEQLHCMFSTCGALISARVATLENGTSKGYGYVRFVSTEDAQLAIQIFHDTVIKGSKISVTQFVPRSKREFVAYIPDLDGKKKNVFTTFSSSVLLNLFKYSSFLISVKKEASILKSTVLGVVGFFSILLYFWLERLFR